MLTQVVKHTTVHERGGGRGDEHLAAVTTGRDPGRAMDVLADVALLGEQRCSCVQSYPHRDRAASESVQRRGGSVERSRRCRERHEERVPLRVHLHTTMSLERRPQHPPMLRQRPRVPVRTELVQQLGRALHVGEQERDRPRGEIAHLRKLRRARRGQG